MKLPKSFRKENLDDKTKQLVEEAKIVKRDCIYSPEEVLIKAKWLAENLGEYDYLEDSAVTHYYTFEYGNLWVEYSYCEDYGENCTFFHSIEVKHNDEQVVQTFETKFDNYVYGIWEDQLLKIFEDEITKIIPE